MNTASFSDTNEMAKKFDAKDLAQLIIDGVKDYAIFMLDSDGVIRTWNDGAKNLKQYEPGEIIGKHFSILYSPQDVEANKPGYELKMAVSLGRFEDEGWRFRKDGSKFWANVIITTLYDKQKHHLGFSKITRDLSERKLAEETLRTNNESLEKKVKDRTLQLSESEDQFRTLANAIPHMVWMAQADGFITWYNQNWYDYTGTTAEQMEGWGWQSVHDPVELEKVLQAWPKSIETGQSFEMEFPLRGKNGEFRWFLTRAIPVRNSQGEITRWFGTNTDIDERRKISERQKNANNELAERVRERTAELELANKEMESFSYSVSHDLRAPLRSIAGFCARLLSHSRQRLDEEGKDNLDRVLAAAQRMGRLIDDLLDLSRVSRVLMKKQTVDLAAMADVVNSELELAEPSGKVRLVVKGPLTPAHCDPGLIQVLMQNLLSNARKYSSRNLEAQVEFGEVLIDNKCFYFVRDNGVGFDMKYAGKLFGAFQRLHSDEEFSGTGIGLATVRRIMLRHGGEVWAEASLNQGATFYFGFEMRTQAEKRSDL